LITVSTRNIIEFCFIPKCTDNLLHFRPEQLHNLLTIMANYQQRRNCQDAGAGTVQAQVVHDPGCDYGDGEGGVHFRSWQHCQHPDQLS